MKLKNKNNIVKPLQSSQALHQKSNFTASETITVKQKFSLRTGIANNLNLNLNHIRLLFYVPNSMKLN